MPNQDNDAEFVKELAKRLNTMIEQNADRSNAVLTTALNHAGYASIAHFLGELALPARSSVEDLKGSLFLFPVIEEGYIKRFDLVTGAFLQSEAEQFH